MAILVKFIFKEFWKYFLIIFIAFIGIFFFADLIANINIIFRYNTSFENYLLYVFFKIPEGLYYIIPISTLTSAMFFFSSLNNQMEIISFRTLQIPKKTIIYPLFISGLIISIISFFINEFIYPTTNYYAKLLRITKIEKKKNFAITKSNNVWYHKNNYFLRIKFLFFKLGIMNNVTLIKVDKNFKIVERIDASYGLKKGNSWELSNAEIYKFSNNSLISFEKKDKIILPISLVKEDFYVIEQKIKNLNIFKLAKIISTLEKNKINARKYKVEFYNKIFYPFVCIIFILMGFYLNVKPVKSGTIISIILATFLGGGYFLLNGFFISLSKIGTLPIIFGPLITFLLYLIIIILLDKKTKY